MLRNYFVVALKNIARRPLYAAISMFGLAVGICAALIAAIVIHAEYHCDEFVPGFERSYLIADIGSRPGSPRSYSDSTSSRTARHIRLHSPEVEALARLKGASVYRPYSSRQRRSVLASSADQCVIA